jgi:hypothetical protein
VHGVVFEIFVHGLRFTTQGASKARVNMLSVSAPRRVVP